MAALDRGGPALLARYFELVRWSVVEQQGDDEDPPWFGWAYRGEHGEWYGQTWWLEPMTAAVTYALCPFEIPAEALAQVADYAHLVNGILATSTVELDFAQRSLRVRAAVVLPIELDDELAMSLVERSILSCLSTMDRVLPGIVLIVGADAPASAAMERFQQLR